MSIQFGERRKTRGRIAHGTCSFLNLDFKGGGGLLRLGAAGALLAAAFAAHHFIIRKRNSGSMPEPLDRADREGIQENSGKRIAPLEAADGENEGKRGVQVRFCRRKTSSLQNTTWTKQGRKRDSKLRLHLFRRWRIDLAGGNRVFETEGGGGCSKRSFLGRFSRRAGGNGANAAGGSFVYPASGGVSPNGAPKRPNK
ncbi:hypothetical protein KSP40_PGU021161 [Platanthera guangdongensis]|uniref:Uncharacterized protein n=1 Tax=Platanthera guangdongensis TaxID=2320717 RepID=A0ABR2MUG2_9ASPA